MMNLKRLSFYIFLFTGVLAVNGCKKFLDILPSSTSVNPTTMKEFQEMLNNDSLSRVNFFQLDYMTDDVQLTDAYYANGDNFLRRGYLWADTYWNPAQDDYMYNSSYTRILQMNIILERIKSAPADELNTAENRSTVISQALINRAWYYLQLVNAYGPAYDAATAKTDLGVPLILEPNADVILGRANVEDVYTRIIEDLKTAVNNPYLKSKGTDIVHPGKAAGFGLLARAYLYKSDYQKAALYADSALLLEKTLYDLTTNTYYPGELVNLVPNPEVLMARICIDNKFYTTYTGYVSTSQALLDSMGGAYTTDRRYTQRFLNKVLRLNSSNVYAMVFDNSVSVPEVMLIKAEYLARNGDAAGAGTILTQLRSKRMPAATVSNRTYTAGNILQYVLGERRRELCFHGGLRLFDLKRLNKEDRFKRNLTRTTGSTGTGTLLATLPAGSPRYLIPFSPNVLVANPKIVQNPR